MSNNNKKLSIQAASNTTKREPSVNVATNERECDHAEHKLFACWSFFSPLSTIFFFRFYLLDHLPKINYTLAVLHNITTMMGATATWENSFRAVTIWSKVIRPPVHGISFFQLFFFLLYRSSSSDHSKLCTTRFFYCDWTHDGACWVFTFLYIIKLIPDKLAVRRVQTYV